MDILGALFGGGKTLPGRFQFADGTTISAKDYGFHSASNFSLQPATTLFEACFVSDEHGPKLPITAVAVRLPAIPHLYFIGFHAAIYLAYAKEVAGADESTLADINAGIASAIDDIRTPDKLPLSSGAKKSLVYGINRMFQAITVDLSEAFAPPTDNTAQQHAKHATKMLLGFVEQTFYETGVEPPPLLSGITSEHAARLHLLDNAPVNLMLFLQKEQKVKFLPTR